MKAFSAYAAAEVGMELEVLLVSFAAVVFLRFRVKTLAFGKCILRKMILGVGCGLRG